jgi:hypothetical protein
MPISQSYAKVDMVFFRPSNQVSTGQAYGFSLNNKKREKRPHLASPAKGVFLVKSRVIQ